MLAPINVEIPYKKDGFSDKELEKLRKELNKKSSKLLGLDMHTGKMEVVDKV